MARRLDKEPTGPVLREGLVPAPASSDSALTAGEREAFELVRIQGMSRAEAARVLEVSEATVNRRLSRGLQLLAVELGDLYPDDEVSAKP